MSLTGDIVAALLADAGVAGLVSDRVYVQTAPQATPEPYITVSPISGPSPQYHLRGETGLAQARYQLDAWCATSGERDTAIGAIRALFSGLQGEITPGGESASFVGFDVIGQPYEAPTDSSERGTFRAICELFFHTS